MEVLGDRIMHDEMTHHVISGITPLFFIDAMNNLYFLLQVGQKDGHQPE